MDHCQPICDAFASVHPDVVKACEDAGIDWKCIVTEQCMSTAKQLGIASTPCDDPDC